MSKPVVEREGDDLIFSWPVEGMRVRVDHIKDSHDEMKAELTVESTAAGESGTLWWGGLNLKAARSRTEVANALYSRAPIEEFWQEALLYVSKLSKEIHREGEPTVDLAAIPFRPTTPYLMSTFLPEGETTIVYGDGEAGKSLLGTAVALSLLRGQPFHSLLVPKAGAHRVLLLDYETSAETHARRRARLGATDPSLGIDLFRYRRVARPITEAMASLRTQVLREAITLVIVDSLGAASGGDPRDPGVAIATMNALHSLGCTCLVIAHITKADAANPDGQATVYGSAFFRYYARSLWEIRKVEGMPRGEMAQVLYQRKSNEDERHAAPIGIRYVFEPNGGPISLSDYDALRNMAAAQGLSQRQRISACLSEDPRTVYELAEETGIGAETVGRVLRLMQGQEAERVEEGTSGRGQVVHWKKAERRNGKAENPPLGGGGELKAERRKGGYIEERGIPPFSDPPSGIRSGVTARDRGAQDAGATNSLSSPATRAGATDGDWLGGISPDYAKEFEADDEELSDAPF